MGAAGALFGWLIRWLALSLRPVVHLNRVLVTSALGLLIGGVTGAVAMLLSCRLSEIANGAPTRGKRLAGLSNVFTRCLQSRSSTASLPETPGSR